MRDEEKRKAEESLAIAESRLFELREPVRFGIQPRVRGCDIYVSPRKLKDRDGGSLWLGKKKKEKKLCSPLNIHDNSFAKANGKHIYIYISLYNFVKYKKRWMRVTACSGANWEEYENLDRRRWGSQGEGSWPGFYLSPLQWVWIPDPFISNGYNETLLGKQGFNYPTLLMGIFFSEKFFFPHI